MASPFSIFRRQEKKLLAVLAIMAMFAFTFVGFAGMSVQALLELFGSGASRPGAEVIARTNGGDITLAEVAEQQRRRAVANRFLYVAQARAGNPFPESNFFGPATEEDVINAMLIRRHARQIGMRIGDDAVGRFIDGVTRNPRTGEQGLTSEEFYRICEEMGVPDRALYDLLSDELMVSQMVQVVGGSSFLGGGAAIMTPAELWESYQKLNTQIALEIAAVPVSDFTAQVPEPSEDELRTFLEQYKDESAAPSSPEPGFKQPRRIQVEYLMANFDRFSEGTEVSEEEIRQYYEENKERYRILDELPENGAESDAGDPADAKPTDESADDTAEPETGDDKPVDAPQDASEAPAADTSPTKPKISSDSADPPAEDEADRATGSAPEPSGEQSPDDGPSGSAKDADDVANQDSVDQQTGDQPQESDEPAIETEPVNSSDTASPAASKSPALTPPVPQNAEAPDDPGMPDVGEATQETQADSNVKAQAAAPGDGRAADTADGQTNEEAATTDEAPEPRYRPLDDVLALQIRDELRRAKAVERIEQVLDTVSYNKMEEYASKLADWESRLEEQQDDPDQPLPEKPERPDLASIADEYGLEYGITPMVSRAEAAELEGIGSAFEFRGSAEQARSFIEVAFDDRPAFEALMARDENSNGYLYWKVADKPQHVPTFEEVRDQVLASWKQREARDEAKARAAELAQTARDADKPLEEVLADNPAVIVQTTPTFTWLTKPPALGSNIFAENPPQPSDVPFVDRAGEEFFQTAFGLSQGEIGTAPNALETIWYVMRVVSRDDATREGFLRENFYGQMIAGLPLPSSYDYLAGRQREQIMQRWLADLQRESGLEWVRQPDAFEDEAVAQR